MGTAAIHGTIGLAECCCPLFIRSFIDYFACLVSQQAYTSPRSLFPSPPLKAGAASETGMELASASGGFSAQLKTITRLRFSSLPGRPWCGVETMYFADEDKI